MKKLVLLTIAALLLCAACSKSENGQITTQKDPIPEAPDTKVAPSTGFSMCFMWWYPDPIANVCMHERFSDSLCGVIVGCDDSTSLAATADFNAANEITRIRISCNEIDRMDYTSTFESFCTRGYIAFANDCMIDDAEIVYITNTNYIPAGMYDITKQNGEYIITINNDVVNPITERHGNEEE